MWFASWFDSPHYHRLYGYRDASEAAGFVDALVDRLHPALHADVLDLGCGAGRHARHLASKGLDVTGFDLSAGSIAQARRFERPGLRFRRHDMRQSLGTEAYDYVFNFFTSFGYFDDPSEHLAVVSNIAGALRPGGTLVLDYLNVRYAEQRQTPEEIKVIDDARYRLTRWSDRQRFYKRIEITTEPASRSSTSSGSRSSRSTIFARCSRRTASRSRTSTATIDSTRTTPTRHRVLS